MASLPTAHSCCGQYIWWLLLWSAIGTEADQCSFSPGEVTNNKCQFKKNVFLSSLTLCWACFQLEQFNMIENPISSTSLYNQCSTLNYTQAAMMGLTGSSLQDSQQLSYSNHSNIPNIILTGNTIIGFSISITCLYLCKLNGSSEALRSTAPVGRFCPLMEAVAGKKKVKASAKMKGMVGSPQFPVLPSCESLWGCFSTLT